MNEQSLRRGARGAWKASDDVDVEIAPLAAQAKSTPIQGAWENCWVFEPPAIFAAFMYKYVYIRE